MLAPREFKTASDLNLRPVAYDALCGVLHRLETGKILDAEFDMSTSCGTPCCILGHAANPIGTSTFRLFDGWSEDPGQRELFSSRFGKTAEQGAYALRAYLTTGTPDWSL